MRSPKWRRLLPWLEMRPGRGESPKLGEPSVLGVYVGPLPARNGAVRLFRLVCPPPRPSSPRRPLVPRPSIVDGQIARFPNCRDTVCTPHLIQSGPPLAMIAGQSALPPAAESWRRSPPGSHNLKYPKPTVRSSNCPASSPVQVPSRPVRVQSSPVLPSPDCQRSTLGPGSRGPRPASREPSSTPTAPTAKAKQAT